MSSDGHVMLTAELMALGNTIRCVLYANFVGSGTLKG